MDRKKLKIAAWTLAAAALLLLLLIVQLMIDQKVEQTPGVISAKGEDMSAYLAGTQDLVDGGNYEAALDRMQWFDEHAPESDPELSGARLTYAIRTWMEFGERYPPAKQAMMKAWEQRIGRLMLGNGDRRTFEVVTAFDGVLEKNQTTVDLFEALDRRHEKLAVECWPEAKDELFDAKRYDLIRKYAPDLVREFERSRDAMQGALHPGPVADPAQEFMRPYYEHLFVLDAMRLIDLALKRHDTASAIQVQQKALKVLDSKRLRQAL